MYVKSMEEFLFEKIMEWTKKSQGEKNEQN
jgi:hypothetical protein